MTSSSSHTSWTDRLRSVFVLAGGALVFDRLLLALEETLHATRLPPDENVDVVIVFGAVDDDDDARRARRRLLTRALLEDTRLIVERLDASFWNRKGRDDVVVYGVTASFQALVEHAEQIDMKKVARKTGRLTRFEVARGPKFVGWADGDRSFFTMTERQTIILDILKQVRGGDDHRLMAGALDDGTVQQVFPMADGIEAGAILRRWSAHPGRDVQRVARYFGTDIAFSFAWLAAYTRFLVAPALLGVIVHLVGNDAADDATSVAFAAAMPILAAVFLELWKRRSARLQYELGVHDLVSFEKPRPGYNATVCRPLPFVALRPGTRRVLTSVATFPVMVLLLAVTAAAMFASFEASDYVRRAAPNSLVVHLPSIVFGLVLSALNALFDKVARCITGWENHRTESSFRTALLTRQILLKCLSAFMSPLYLMFWVQDIGRVRQQLAALLITSQLQGQVQEVGLPIVMALYRAVRSQKTRDEVRRDLNALANGPQQQAAQRRGAAGRRILPSVEAESIREVYDGTADDYAEMVIQFGYVFVFGWCWPLASLCALLNNVTENRTDCFKLCVVMQKPRPRHASGIGVWLHALQALSIGAVLVNTAYMFLHVCRDDVALLRGWTTVQKIAAVIALEHVVIGARFLVDYVVEDVPEDVRRRMADDQVEYARQMTNALRTPPTSFRRAPAPPHAKAA